MKRQLHLFHEVVELFDKSIENAEALLRSYRNKLLRKCQKGDNYACVAFIGLFESKATDMTVRVDRNGKKTISKSKTKKIGNPEIHAIILAIPSRTLATETEKYFAKHNGKAFSYIYDNNAGYVLPYVIQNSSYYRTVILNPELLPEKNLNELINIAECINVTTGGRTPIFEDLSANRYDETKKILQNAGLDLISSTDCSKKEQIIRQSQIAQLFGINFTTYESNII